MQFDFVLLLRISVVRESFFVHQIVFSAPGGRGGLVSMRKQQKFGHAQFRLYTETGEWISFNHWRQHEMKHAIKWFLQVFVCLCLPVLTAGDHCKLVLT